MEKVTGLSLGRRARPSGAGWTAKYRNCSVFRRRGGGVEGETERFGGYLDVPHRVGSARAIERRTMNTSSTKSSNRERESNLTSSRLVAAAGSLLNYWTDFGRFFTKLP